MKPTLDLRRSTTTSKTASTPTSCSAGWPCSWGPHRRDHHRRDHHRRDLAGHPRRPGTPAPITFTGPAGTFRQTTELTKPQRDLFTALAIEAPKKIIEIAAADPGATDAPVA